MDNEYIKNTHNQTNFDLKIKNIDNSNNHLMTQILSKRNMEGIFAVGSSIIQKFLRKNIVQVAQSGYSFIEDTKVFIEVLLSKKDLTNSIPSSLYSK